MTTKAEAARAAFKAAIDAAIAAQTAAPLSDPYRNEPLSRAFEADEQGRKVFLNLVDGDLLPLSEEIGGVIDGEEEFEVEVRVELIVRDRSAAARDAVLDDCLAALAAITAAAPTLSGACDAIRILPPRQTNLSVSGLPGLKACELPVRFLVSAETFIS